MGRFMVCKLYVNKFGVKKKKTNRAAGRWVHVRGNAQSLGRLGRCHSDLSAVVLWETPPPAVKGSGPSSYPWFQRGRKAASAPSSDTGLGSAAVGPRHKSFRSPDTCKPRNRCLNTPRASQRTWASGGHVGASTAEGRPFCLLPSASGKDTACTIYEERG